MEKKKYEKPEIFLITTDGRKIPFSAIKRLDDLSESNSIRTETQTIGEIDVRSMT